MNKLKTIKNNQDPDNGLCYVHKHLADGTIVYEEPEIKMTTCQHPECAHRLESEAIDQMIFPSYCTSDGEGWWICVPCAYKCGLWA